MVSVTQRVESIKQPRGGYISIKTFQVIENEDNSSQLYPGLENINAGIVGSAVEYLTRAILTGNPLRAFEISIWGAEVIGEQKIATKKAKSITYLTPESIISACQLAGYDVCFRAGVSWYKPVQDILPDDNTIKNIETMVKRSIHFFNKYGPVIEEGFTFEGGYSLTVSSGDGDFITADTLWDFKVSKKEPSIEHTLQLLMYYIMGTHSKNKNLHGIRQLGIYNPRLNKVYLKQISSIPIDVIRQIESEVLEYKK